LYIAKIINEKTQLALTFDDKGKAQLGLEFATNRVDEMNKVLAEESSSNNDQKVEQLVNNFKDQIKEVRTRIAKINPNSKPENVAGAGKVDNGNTVLSADLGKETQGIQISEPVADVAAKVIKKSGKVEEKVATSSQELTVDSGRAAATTTAPVATTAEILQEAGKLLNENNYSATLQKIDEADKSLVQVEKGEVKGESENATSTTK
jgi:hypothetical protein